MKSLTLFFIAICLILPTIVQAESPFSSLQSAKEKKSYCKIYANFVPRRHHYLTMHGKK